MILVFNKTDVQDASFAKEWMTDFEAFQSALQKEADNSDGEGGSGYMGSLMNSMSLVLDEFYAHLDVSITYIPLFLLSTHAHTDIQLDRCKSPIHS